MGRRISYYKNNFNKGLKDLLFENFFAFREWYLETNKLSLEECDEPFGNEQLRYYFENNSDLKNDFENLEKKLVDELTSDFISSYCDLTDRDSKILEFFGPTMYTRHYERSTEMVLKTKDQDFIRLWSFVVKGRSLKDYGAFDSYTNENKIGFLSFEEHRKLKHCIETYFGDIEKIKERYWTNKEKKAFKNALADSKDGSYSLSGHNPKSSGLEYMLEVLEEIGDGKNELITDIE